MEGLLGEQGIKFGVQVAHGAVWVGESAGKVLEEGIFVLEGGGNLEREEG